MTLRNPSRTVFLVAITAALPLPLLLGCKDRAQGPVTNAPALPAATVAVRGVETARETSTREVLGTVRARLRATLEAKTTGRIEEMPVVLGQKVKAGDPIATLQAAETKARLERARAGLAQAEREWKRVSALFDQQAMTRSDRDAAESTRDIARAALEEAEAQMSYAQVNAPFDGVITRKFADRGDLAVPGKPLVLLEDPTRLQVESDIPESAAGQIVSGSRMRIRLDGVAEPLNAVVSEIAPAADPDSRTLRVKLDLDPGAPARPGQFARLLVPAGESEVMRVPASAVLRRGQMELVYVVENGRARLHLVKAGGRAGDAIEILSGLEPKDQVVVEGAAQLRDGQPVNMR